MYLLLLYCVYFWSLKIATIKSNTNQDKISKFSDYYMKAERHELDSCFHREEREEQRSKKREVKHFYMKWFCLQNSEKNTDLRSSLQKVVYSFKEIANSFSISLLRSRLHNFHPVLFKSLYCQLSKQKCVTFLFSSCKICLLL